MKKLGLLFRETLENNIKKHLKESDSVFVIKYSKLSSPDITALRQSLKGINATLFVSKNSIIRLALKEAKLDDLIKFVDGPCGLVFAKGELVDTSRALYNFYREHEQLQLECGLMKDKLLDKKDIETLARLPNKEVLRAQVVTALNSPISGLVGVLKQTLRKFVYCLDKIKQKKSTVNSPQSTTEN
ncbi:MAG: 50S ribosomal protein L10 [Candidatus Omnitrophota bacterium]|nr:50S ribosomal protein L10 [Candidatus Omnitrophota bacterium]